MGERVLEKAHGELAPRRWLAAALRIGGSALALALLFHFLPVKEVWGTLRKLPLNLWVFVIAGYLTAHVIAVNKWRLMVNLAGANLALRQSAVCYFAGLFSTLLLPSIVGGDVVRAVTAFRSSQSKTAVVLGGIADRMIDFAALLILATVGAALIPLGLPSDVRRVFVIVGTALALIAATILFAIALFPEEKLPSFLRGHAANSREVVLSLRRRPHYVGVALVLGLIVQGTFIWLTARVAEAAGLHLALRAWLFAWPLAKFSGLIPITQGGIGVREAALVVLLKPLGAPPVKTAAVGLAWEAVIISGGILAGLAALALSHLAKHETAQRTEDELLSPRR